MFYSTVENALVSCVVWNNKSSACRKLSIVYMKWVCLYLGEGWGEMSRFRFLKKVNNYRQPLIWIDATLDQMPHPSPPHLSLLKLINSALLINTRTLGCIERILQSADFKIVQWEVTCLTRMETRRWSDNWNRNRQISEASRYLLFWPLKQRVQNALILNYAEHMWNCFRVSHSVVVPKPIRAGQVLVSHW